MHELMRVLKDCKNMGDITQRGNILHTSPFYFNADTGVTKATKLCHSSAVMKYILYQFM
jgi:hypothetical protein